MLEVSEVGNKISKEDYKAAIPDLRVDLINAQYDLGRADFPVVIWIAGDDRMAANALVNRLNEWMDSRFIECSPNPPPRNTSAHRCGGCGARCRRRAGRRSSSGD